jgi:hypothetical protein
VRHVPLSIDELRALGRQRSGGVALGDGQAAVLGALHAHAFLSPHCCPSQALIAAEVGLTREWVNRICRELWELGLICWSKASRLGSRWWHNVYALRHWSPPPRARLLSLVDLVRGRRARSLHTERTTRTTEGSLPLESWSRDASEGPGRARPPDAGAELYEPTFDEVPW